MNLLSKSTRKNSPATGQAKIDSLESRLFFSAYSFSDEFNETVGGGPSSAWGRFNTTDPNNGNVNYTNTLPANATASNPATLQIVNDATANDGKALSMSLMPKPNANGSYDSAEIATEADPSGAGNAVEYGHVEARIRLPGGSNSNAIWPAFWMLGDNISSVSWPTCGEIDIMENRGSQPGINNSTLHGLASGGGDYNGGAGVGATYTLPGGASYYSAYHVFAADWGPNSITFSVDGTPYYTLTPANLPAGATWEFNNHPFYIILDMCEGGGFAPGTITTTQTMYVDYVHVSSYSVATASTPPLADLDIGSPSPAGSAYFDGVTTTLNGGGTDIYGTTDQFTFDSESVTGNVTAIAQVDWVSDTAQYAKGGLMIRDGSAANASYAFLQLNPYGGGVNGVGGASLEFRNGAGTSAYTIGTDASADLVNGPIWLKLVRSGNVFTGYDSSNGTSWTQIGSSQTVSMSTTAQVGLADDSYKNGTLSTDTFSNVNILPSTFTEANIGAPIRNGTAGFYNSTSSLVVSGGGTGIVGTSDQFDLVSQAFSGDGVVIADLTSQNSTNATAMAGVMLRTSSAANSAYAAVMGLPTGGARFVWRTSGGVFGSVALEGTIPSMWLEIVRSGNNISAFQSLNGTIWSQVGTTQSVTLGTNILAGLAVTSGDTVSTDTATFNGVVAPNDTLNAGVNFTIPAATSGGIEDFTLNGVTVASSGILSLANPSSYANRTVLTTGSLNLAGSTGAWNSTVDLGENDLIVHNGNLTQLTNQLATGFNAVAGGNWNGKGIDSSIAAASTTHLTALGIIQNNNGSGQPLYGSAGALGVFDNQNPTVTDVLIKYTYFGDANLDGHVDGSDYSKIDNGLLNNLNGWGNGDFNYDGVVNGSDYTLIDNAFNSQGAALNATVADVVKSNRLTATFASAPAIINSMETSQQKKRTQIWLELNR